MRHEYREQDLAALAAPLTILDTPARRLVAQNRIVYQPMEANDAAPGGAPGEATLLRYRARAEGGAGIDFVEALAVSRGGKARGNQLLFVEENRGAFERLVEDYRRISPSTVLLFQLTHSGRFAERPVTAYPVAGESVALLTDDDLRRIADDTVRATRLAFECGADGIDFKHCHGYLFGQLLGPANGPRANWSFGGETVEERARFFTETMARMRATVPLDRFLVTVRISAFEGIPGGFGSRDPTSDTEDPGHTELIAFSRIMEREGVGLVNQSSGVPEITPLLVRQTNENAAAFFDHQIRADVIKRAVGIPVIGSGYSYPKAGKNRLPGDDPKEKSFVSLAGRALREGRVDFVGIGRQSLSDPGFARKLLTGRFDEIRWDTSCNKCAVSLRSGIEAGCVTYDPQFKALFQTLPSGGAGRDAPA